MKFYRGTKVFLTDILLVFIAVLVLISIVFYSKMNSSTDLIVQTLVLKTVELDHKVKQIENVIEKKWVENLNKRHR